MRIAVAHESVGTDGGVETYLLSTIQGLRHRGHQVALVYYRRSDSATPLRSSSHVALGIEEHGIDAVFDELGAWRPDVAFSHNMGPLIVDRRLMDRWPAVKMLHGYFGTCVSGLKMHAFPSPCACDRTFGPACLALYAPRRCGELSASAMIRGYRWAHEQRGLFGRYARTIVASQHMRDEMLRHGAPGDRLDVLPLFSTLKSQAESPSAERDTVLFAGRMTSLKGGQVLVECRSTRVAAPGSSRECDHGWGWTAEGSVARPRSVARRTAGVDGMADARRSCSRLRARHDRRDAEPVARAVRPQRTRCGGTRSPNDCIRRRRDKGVAH